MDTQSSRREFLATSVAAVTLVGAASPPVSGLADERPALPNPQKSLHIKPRYHRWYVDPGVDWVETNTGAATLDWSIPLSEAAIVLVDVWNHHYLKDTEARAESIIDSKLVPLLAACREVGLPIIHAPSPPQAQAHPNHVKFERSSPAPPTPPAESWPPSEFRSKSGRYAAYKRPNEPRDPELRKIRAGLTIHPKVQPVGQEPVVATGDELHKYCKAHGILFLLFAGFNTNACILVRDYGTLAMRSRGYEVAVIRDCTTGMESKESQPTLSQTEGAILFLEMFDHYSISSDEIRSGLPKVV